MTNLKKPSPEKRKTTRLSPPLKVEYALSSSPNTFRKILAKDISGGGIKFQADKPFKKNEHLILKLYFPHHKKHIKILAEVVWCQELADEEKKYLAGIKFIKVSPAEKENFAIIIGELMVTYCMFGKTT